MNKEERPHRLRLTEKGMVDESQPNIKSWYQSRWGFTIAIWLFNLVLFGFLGTKMYESYSDPHYYPWPKITRCRGCEKVIWAWQHSERRTSPCPIEGNGQNFAISVSMSSLFHKDCPTVKPDPITITVGTVPHGVGLRVKKAKLNPQEQAILEAPIGDDVKKQWVNGVFSNEIKQPPKTTETIENTGNVDFSTEVEEVERVEKDE